MDWVTVSNKIYNKNFPELRGRLILVDLAVMATILGISATSIYIFGDKLVNNIRVLSARREVNEITERSESDRLCSL